MDQIRKILATIQKHLGAMTPTQKLLLGSLAVIMVMTLFLVSQYAGVAKMQPVWPGMGADAQAKAGAFLQRAGYQIGKDSQGQVTVPTALVTQAYAALLDGGQQPENAQLVFDNILKAQSWTNSKEQNRELYKLMRDNWFSGVIGKLQGISSAKVFVDAPEAVGLGASVRPPKASITLFSSTGQAVSQHAVDAAANLVAGSVAGLDLDRINVIDGTMGRPCKVRTDDDMASATNRENARAIERDYETKIASFLSDIEGVVVAVTATVDTTRARTEITKTLGPGEGTVSVPKKEMTQSQTEAQANNGAEAGVRSNVAANIATGGNGSGKNEQKTEETEYATSFGTEHREIADPRGTPQRLVATIGVPRAYVLGALQRAQPAAAATGGGAAPGTPSEAEIQAQFEKEKVRITQAALLHLKARTADGVDVPGEVAVVMMAGPGTGGGGGAGGGSIGGGMGGALGTMWAMGGGMVDKVVLGVLAAAALGMMGLMVRRAGKRVEMPTPEELVGLPPALETKTDLVGEADETDTAMAGIEVGEEEIKSSKMRESVSDFIKQSPDAASKLLNRWVSVEH